MRNSTGLFRHNFEVIDCKCRGKRRIRCARQAERIQWIHHLGVIIGKIKCRQRIGAIRNYLRTNLVLSIIRDRAVILITGERIQSTRACLSINVHRRRKTGTLVRRLYKLPSRIN